MFSPEKNEVFWSAKPDGEQYFKLYYIKKMDGTWQSPVPAPFFADREMFRPVFSHDGGRLYFDCEDDIWYVEKKGDSWGDPVKVSSVINSAEYERLNGITKDGSIYFTRFGQESGNDYTEIVYVSRFKNGQFSEPVELGEAINSAAHELFLYIYPDERYMLIEETRDNAICNVFITYKMNDGTWSSRINSGLGWARFPAVSPDGRYLFFMKRDGIYWTNTAFIDELRLPEND